MTIPDEKFYRAQITRRIDFAPDLWMFRIRSGGEFKFIPGQYATLGVEEGGKRVERPYSIASSPAEDEVEFFFELVPEGALTPLLHKMQVGDQLLMRKAPKGRFSLDTSERPEESSADFNRHRCGAVRQLCADAAQRMAGGPLRRLAQALSTEWRESAVGVWLYRRIEPLRQDIPLVQVCAYGEPAVGSRRLAG